MRPRRSFSSARQASAWLIVASGLALYVALVLVLLMASVWPGPPLPWWVTQGAPVVAYGALVRIYARRASAPRWITAAFSLWAVHLVLAELTGAAAVRWAPPTDSAVTGTLQPLPLLPIFWVPLLLIPLRDLLTGDPRLRQRLEARGSERGVAPDRRAPAPLLAPSNAAGAAAQVITPAASKASASSEGVMTDAMQPREAQATGGRPLDHGGPASPRVTPTQASAAGLGAMGEPLPRLSDAMPGRETSAEVVRVSFDRVAGQLPADAFHLPLDRMAASLLEPGYLLIPQDLVLAQLAEGLVRAGWEVVGEQFPRHLLAMADEEITRKLPDGQLVLPLDELVPQLPLELFAPAGPPVDVEGIESVPEPFQPAVSEGGVEEPVQAFTAGAPLATEAPGTVEPPSPKTEWSLDEVEEETGLERHDLLALEDIEIDPALTGMVDDEAASTATCESDLQPFEAASLDEPASEALTTAERSIDEAVETGPEAPAARALQDAELDPVLPELIEPDLAPGAELRFRDGQWPEEARDERSPTWNGVVTAIPPATEALPLAIEHSRDEIVTARSVAALFAPLKVFGIGVESVDGVKLFTVSAPGLSGGPAVGVAGLLVPLLADRHAPWRVNQMTLRGPDVALVLTPLGQGDAVLVSAAPPGRTLALLEILSLRAAAGYSSDAAVLPRVGPDAGEGRLEPQLLDIEPPARVAQIAATLSALGPVMAGALCDPDAERDLYLFLPSGSDVRAMGGFAGELDCAIGKAAASGQTFHTAVLRCGRRCLVIRLWRGATGSSRVVVAGGETERPGLAFRQVESAALLLGAH